MKIFNSILVGIFLVAIFVLQTQAADPIAVIIKTKGKVNVYRAANNKVVAASKGLVLYHGDKVRTLTASFCALKFIDDKSLLRIKEKSSCVIEGQRKEDHINKNIVVEIGSFFASLFKQKGTFKVTTPTSVASVKGTKFWIIQLGDGRTFYIGIEGLVDLSNKAGRVLLRSGQTAIFTSRNELPEIRLTQPGEIPKTEEEQGGNKLMEIEFRDSEGRTRKLQIEYKEK